MFSYLKRIHYQAYRATEHDWMYKIETINAKLKFPKANKAGGEFTNTFYTPFSNGAIADHFYQIF